MNSFVRSLSQSFQRNSSSPSATTESITSVNTAANDEANITGMVEDSGAVSITPREAPPEAAEISAAAPVEQLTLGSEGVNISGVDTSNAERIHAAQKQHGMESNGGEETEDPGTEAGAPKAALQPPVGNGSLDLEGEGEAESADETISSDGAEAQAETIEVEDVDEGEDEEEEGEEEGEEEELDEEDVEEEEDGDAEDEAEELSDALQRALQTRGEEDAGSNQPRGMGNGLAPRMIAPRPNPRLNGPAGGAPMPGAPSSADAAVVYEPEMTPSQRKSADELLNIRVMLLRIAHRLGSNEHNTVVAQVLYRLRLAEQMHMRQAGRGSIALRGTLEARASGEAARLDAEEGVEGDIGFECTLMLVGKAGVGKTATINSILDRPMSPEPPTKRVREVVGDVHGIRLRIIDTPGLEQAAAEQPKNERILQSVKKFIKKKHPDIVLYCDRLDMVSGQFSDLPLMRTITEVFGQTIWFNAMVVLTHSCSALPEDSRGSTMSYEAYVAQRSIGIQTGIRMACQDNRLMSPVALAENHPNCRRNRSNERVLPNGQVWRPQLLLLAFSSKILGKANSIMRSQQDTGHLNRVAAALGGQRPRQPPLPYLLSQLLNERHPVRKPNQPGDDEEHEDELLEEDDPEAELEEEELPPFAYLKREDLGRLTPQQRKEYEEEVEDRERSAKMKEWRDQIRRRREAKRYAKNPPGDQIPSSMGGPGMGLEDAQAQAEEEAAREAQVPVMMPDMTLPLSFDGDNPVHRYRYLDTPSSWLVRPLLEQHGWDHDSGYDAFSVEKNSEASALFPYTVTAQLSKDKKDAQVMLESTGSFWIGGDAYPVITTGLDVTTVGNKELAYSGRADLRSKVAKGLILSLGLGSSIIQGFWTKGLKGEGTVRVGRKGKLHGGVALMRTKGEMAKGACLEGSLKHSQYPWHQGVTSAGLSLIDWHGDLAVGANVGTGMEVGKHSVQVRSSLNNRAQGQLSIRVASNEDVRVALIGLIPVLRHLIGNKLFGGGGGQEDGYDG